MDTSWMISWYHPPQPTTFREFFEAECMDLGPPWSSENTSMTRYFDVVRTAGVFTRKGGIFFLQEKCMHLKVWKIWGIWLWVKFAKHVLHGPFRLLSFAHGSIFTLALVEKNHTSSSRQSKKKLRRFDVMFGFWKVQKVFDVLVVPASFGKTPFIQTAGSPVNLPAFKWSWWEKRLRVAPVFPPRETSLPGDAHCYTLAHYTSLLLRKKNPEKPSQPWLRHASAPLATRVGNARPRWRVCDLDFLDLERKWKISVMVVVCRLPSEVCQYRTDLQKVIEHINVSQPSMRHQWGYMLFPSESLSSAPLSLERTSTSSTTICAMYAILFVSISTTWNPIEHRLGLLAKKIPNIR